MCETVTDEYSLVSGRWSLSHSALCQDLRPHLSQHAVLCTRLCSSTRPSVLRLTVDVAETQIHGFNWCTNPPTAGSLTPSCLGSLHFAQMCYDVFHRVAVDTRVTAAYRHSQTGV